MKQDPLTNPLKPASSVPLPKAKRGLHSFFNDVRRELRHVQWPKVSETNRLTGVVISVCILVIVMLFLLSTVFNTIFTALFRGGAS